MSHCSLSVSRKEDCEAITGFVALVPPQCTAGTHCGFPPLYGHLCGGSYDIYVGVGSPTLYLVWYFVAYVCHLVGGDVICGDLNVLLPINGRGLSLVVVVVDSRQCVWSVYVRVCHLLLVLYRANERVVAVFHVFWIYIYDVVCMLFDVGRSGTLVLEVVCGQDL